MHNLVAKTTMGNGYGGQNKNKNKCIKQIYGKSN